MKYTIHAIAFAIAMYAGALCADNYSAFSRVHNVFTVVDKMIQDGLTDTDCDIVKRKLTAIEKQYNSLTLAQQVVLENEHNKASELLYRLTR